LCSFCRNSEIWTRGKTPKSEIDEHLHEMGFTKPENKGGKIPPPSCHAHDNLRNNNVFYPAPQAVCEKKMREEPDKNF